MASEGNMAGGDGWARVSAVLDQLTSERERAVRRGEAVFMPTLREVRDETIRRFGRGVSFRDLGPLVSRYIAENDVARKLPVRSRPRSEPAEGEDGETLPVRVRRGVDRALGATEAARAGLARVLAEEVEAETEALRRQIVQLEIESSELRRLLADREEILAAADEAEERAEAAQRAADYAEERSKQVLEVEGELRSRVAEGEARLAEAEARRGQAEATLAALTAALSGEREARAADRATIASLMELVRQPGQRTPQTPSPPPRDRSRKSRIREAGPLPATVRGDDRTG